MSKKRVLKRIDCNHCWRYRMIRNKLSQTDALLRFIVVTR